MYRIEHFIKKKRYSNEFVVNMMLVFEKEKKRKTKQTTTTTNAQKRKMISEKLNT